MKYYYYYSLYYLLFFSSLQNLVSSSKLETPLLLPLKAIHAPNPTNKLTFKHNVSLTVSLAVGSPLQQVTMVLDTGSELPWLRCQKQPGFSLVFNPLMSKTYTNVNCVSQTCKTRTRDLLNPVTCSLKKLCHVIVSYADSTSIEGSLASDTFSMGSITRPGTLFGCMDSGSSSNLEEDRKSTGLIGMNRGTLSLVNQMGLTKFAYCISGLGSTGLLVLGSTNLPVPNKSLSYTPLVKITTPLPYFDRQAYTVSLQGIWVNNKVLSLPKSAFELDHTGAGQTMVDSGTQFTFLLGPVYNALKQEFMNQTKILRLLNDPNFVFQGAMDLCYLIDSSISAPPRLPTVTLMLSGIEMRIATEKLLYKVVGEKRGRDSVWCFTFGNSDLLGIEAFVIGHHHQQDIWLEYDLANSRIGFAEINCGLASQKLGLVT